MIALARSLHCLVMGHRLYRVAGNCWACRRCRVNRFEMP